jgi:hypothetical protein
MKSRGLALAVSEIVEPMSDTGLHAMKDTELDKRISDLQAQLGIQVTQPGQLPLRRRREDH